MPAMLFRLRGVSADEAEEIEQLLTANGIEYYETPDGLWGISMPAIWIRNETQLERARALIERYQEERTARVRAEYEQLKRDGAAETLVDRVKQAPLRFVLYVAGILLVLYLSIKPFLELGK